MKVGLAMCCLHQKLANSTEWVSELSILGWEDPLEKGTSTHFSILAWRIP